MTEDSKTCGCNASQDTSLQPESQAESDAQAEMSHLSVFDVPKMDCPSEEQMIRMKLDGVNAIQKLDFESL